MYDPGPVHYNAVHLKRNLTYLCHLLPFHDSGSSPSLGAQLDRAKESYVKAMGQLVHGKANLIQQANDFKRLGVSVQTPLPDDLVAKALLELSHMGENDGGEATNVVSVK